MVHQRAIPKEAEMGLLWLLVIAAGVYYLWSRKGERPEH